MWRIEYCNVYFIFSQKISEEDKEDSFDDQIGEGDNFSEAGNSPIVSSDNEEEDMEPIINVEVKPSVSNRHLSNVTRVKRSG